MLTLTFLNQSQHRQFSTSEPVIRVVGADRGGKCEIENVPVIEVHGIEPGELDLELNRIQGCDGDPKMISMFNRGRSVALSSGPRIHRGRQTELELPVSFCVGQTQFQLNDDQLAHAIDEALISSRHFVSLDSTGPRSKQSDSPGPETLAAWLDTLSELQQVAAGSDQLFQLAARAVFNPGGLDGCLILNRAGADWRIAASHIPYPDHGICYRADLIERCLEAGELLYHDAKVLDSQNDLNDTHTTVVCPIFDADHEVAAVIYGFRSLHRRNQRKGIRLLEAQFVQVVADSLSAGMIRLASEAEVARTQVLLEQAFPPRIARQLKNDRCVLEPRVQEVSVLFADLRGFSSLAERLGAQPTFDLLGDVMDQFSNAITDLDGVVIDFYGDGLSAFWNAPVAQPEHAVLACQAAVEIVRTLPQLNARWQALLGRPLDVGVGIHTGLASVGNSGSRNRLKYGPRGTTVNLASRIENLTKQTPASILISGETAKAIEGVFTTRGMDHRALDGHEQAIEVVELVLDSLAQQRSAFSDKPTESSSGESTKVVF